MKVIRAEKKLNIILINSSLYRERDINQQNFFDKVGER